MFSVSYASKIFLNRTMLRKHHLGCSLFMPFFISFLYIAGLITYRVKMEISSVVWIQDFSLQTSLAYLQLKKKIEELVLKVYVKDRTLASAMVENFQKATAKKNRIPGSKTKARSGRRVSSVTVSLILKFGPRAGPDPTRPLQTHLAKHRGRMMTPLNEKAKIESIEIVKPGVSPAFLGSCVPSCASKCLMSCNPMCCTSRIVLNSFNPYQYPSPVRQPAKPYKIIKSPKRPRPQWPYGARTQTSGPPMPITLSVTCIPTLRSPCPPGIRTPRKLQATYTPGSPALNIGPRKLPKAPQAPYGIPGQAPCVPSPFNRCLPSVQSNARGGMSAGMLPFPIGVVPPQVQQTFPRYPAGMMAPCIPTQFSPCPPPNRKLSKPSTKKPKSRARMPLPRPTSYTFPFGFQRIQKAPNVSPYFNPLLRYNPGQTQAAQYPRPMGFSPLYQPQNMQVPYARPCVPTKFNGCPPRNLWPKAVKVEPVKPNNAKKQKQKPAELSLTQPVNLMGQIYIHPPPGLQFSPLVQSQNRFRPRPLPLKTTGKKRQPPKKKMTGKSSFKIPVTLTSPVAMMGKVMLGQNAPGYAPVRMPNPCVPSAINPCIPSVPQPMMGRVMFGQNAPNRAPVGTRNPCVPSSINPCIPRAPQPVMPYLPAPSFQLPIGVQHPLAGLRPLTPPPPPPGIVPLNFPNMPQPRPVLPAPPQRSGPSRSLIIQFPPIRINYPGNQVPMSLSVPIQQPPYPINNLIRSQFPGYCPRSCVLSPPLYCPSYCPRHCCKKPNQRRAKVAKNGKHKKQRKRSIGQ